MLILFSTDVVDVPAKVVESSMLTTGIVGDRVVVVVPGAPSASADDDVVEVRDCWLVVVEVVVGLPVPASCRHLSFASGLDDGSEGDMR